MSFMESENHKNHLNWKRSQSHIVQLPCNRLGLLHLNQVAHPAWSSMMEHLPLLWVTFKMGLSNTLLYELCVVFASYCLHCTQLVFLKLEQSFVTSNWIADLWFLCWRWRWAGRIYGARSWLQQYAHQSLSLMVKERHLHPLYTNPCQCKSALHIKLAGSAGMPSFEMDNWLTAFYNMIFHILLGCF